MPEETYKDVPLCNLDLDHENPRLPRDRDRTVESQSQLLSEFGRRYNLVELARSIADKGFTPRHAEALLVIPHPDEVGRYVVVEGNRRLATLRLLQSPEQRREAGITGSEWGELAEDASGKGLDNVPVVVYADRAGLDDYLGFRHIAGPRPWRPEAKARFIAKLLTNGETIGDVARRIGSNHRTVRRYAEAHAIYTQAVDEGIPMERAEHGYGVFYNALDQQGVREFLGLGRQVDIATLPEMPVPPERLSDLKNSSDCFLVTLLKTSSQ